MKDWEDWYFERFVNKDTDQIMASWFADWEAIERVRELHKPFEHSLKFGEFYGCHQCSSLDDLVAYPCPTIKALYGEQ